MEGDRVEYYRRVASSLPPMQKFILALDVALTGKPPEQCVGQYHHQPATVEKFLATPGGHPIWYLSDSGYSRIGWDEDEGKVFLTFNSTSRVKENWDKAAPERKALEDYLNTEYKRLQAQAESRHGEIIVDKLLEGEFDPQARQEPDWEKFSQRFGDLEQQTQASTAKFGELRRSVQSWLPKQGGENAQQIMTQMGELEGKYAERDKLLAKIRYAAAYRSALGKAGVKPADVTQRFTEKVERPGKPRQLLMTGVELRDGRRVKIGPIEVPNALVTRW